MIASITTSKPELGSTVRGQLNTQIIYHASADKPYIMGAGVFGITPSLSTTSLPQAVVGKATNDKNRLLGVMALGIGHVVQRDVFVTAGYAESYNNIGVQGGFYVALDLQYFDDKKLANAKLTVDGNGVFSFTSDAVNSTGANTTATANIAVAGDFKVIRIYSKAILNPINTTIGNYTFNYPKGIGALELVI